MASTELTCPACGRVQPPTLLEPPPELFTCDGCLLEAPRTKLVPKYKLNWLLAGSAGSGFVVRNVTSATLYDAGQTTDTYTTAAFRVSAGETIVVGLVSRGGAEITNPPTVTLVGSGIMTPIVENGADAAIFSGIYSATGVGIFTVSAAFSGLPNPISSALFVTSISRFGVVAPDRSASAYSPSAATPSSGPTGVLATSPEAIIAILGLASTPADPASVWLDDLASAQRVGTSGGTNDCLVHEARSIAPTTGSVTPRATQSATEVVCAVATFRVS